MIRLPLYAPRFLPGSSRCYQLRIYKMGSSIEVEPDVWAFVEKFGAGYWFYGHTKECYKKASEPGRRCGAAGWLYWQDGASEEDVRANLAHQLLMEVRPRMPEIYDSNLARGPWNSIGLYEKFNPEAV